MLILIIEFNNLSRSLISMLILPVVMPLYSIFLLSIIPKKLTKPWIVLIIKIDLNLMQIAVKIIEIRKAKYDWIITLYKSYLRRLGK